ncbi:MAG: type II toxin-antitoxin system RelE/ParE family toxin [Bacteroidetes bacterium]|nr:type II toxin-antitoxin system RelE/ParE family toxin [Bacteroidota bacterium]
MKKYNVIFDNVAEDDIYEIYDYVLKNDSTERADKLFNAIRKTCAKLNILPFRGHIPPEFYELSITEVREIRLKPYRIFYTIEDNTIFIHAVLDGRRDIQTILFERNLR